MITNQDIIPIQKLVQKTNIIPSSLSTQNLSDIDPKHRTDQVSLNID